MTASDACTSNDNAVLNAIFNPHTPYVENTSVELTTSSSYNAQVISENLKKLEIDAVNFAQKGDLEESLSLLNRLITEAPHYASAYNNRAQVLRIKGDDESALKDLDKAISLSAGSGLAASQAYVQRGLLYKLAKDDDKAEKDFESAAKLGNTFAKSQLTAMNPYAALCNQMLGEVFSRIYHGEPDMT